MIDAALTLAIVAIVAMVTAGLASRQERAMRPWMWLAFAEYLACGVAQFIHNQIENGDATYYRDTGLELARFLDASFGWASGELFSLLLQQPSAFDAAVIGAGSNTGSMCAAAAWIMFLVRGSEYAAQALIAGLAMLGALAIYTSSRDAYPEVSPLRLFVATVLFPSVAFWTSALHKEAFCLMGTGLLLAAWRAAYNRRLRVILYAPAGLILILMFRAPALPPLLLGIVLFFVVNRIQKARGAEATIVGPIYMGLGLGALAVGMVLVSSVSPELGLDRIGDAVAVQQRAWDAYAGGSAFGLEEPAAQTTAGQLARAPLALVNALFRPQLFDVTNPLVLVSALEMTALTWMIIRAVRLNGFGGTLVRIQRSPFLLMCTVITLVGCTFIGLTTRNFGSMARYRVPFLPFYGALLAVLTERTEAALASKGPSTPAAARDALRRGAGRRAAPGSA